MDNKVTAIGTANTKAYRVEFNQLIAHYLGIAMINIELAKGSWNPWKRKKYFALAEDYKAKAAELLYEYHSIWRKKG